jgi:organic radical activating enzyme
MAYTVKEIFYTLQGEGANAGRPAVFCRFANPSWRLSIQTHKAVGFP